MAPFSEKERRSSRDTEAPVPAALVQQALLPAIRLDLLPKSSIDVHITVLDSDTSVLGCAAMGATAASAALAEAGVQMLGLVTGATAVRITCILMTHRPPFQRFHQPTKRSSYGLWIQHIVNMPIRIHIL